MSINKIKDYYYLLGLAESASKEEIKKAYRKLSLKFHPDQNKGDKFFEGRFIDVNEAYKTLIDDIKRQWFDDKLHSINNGYVSEKNYNNRRTRSPHTQTQEECKQANTRQAWSSPASTSQKQKSLKPIYLIIAILCFTIPFLIRIVFSNPGKDDDSKNTAASKYSTIQKIADNNGTATIINNAKAAISNVQPVGSSASLKPADAPASNSQNGRNQPPTGFTDEDGSTATDVLKYFLKALNNHDCNGAWSMSYNETWQNNGQDWFYSSQGFGGIRKILIRKLYPVMQNYSEIEMYVDYYAEDIYNGNKCFKQNITLREIAFTDKTRWKVTSMRNVEEPVACNGN